MRIEMHESSDCEGKVVATHAGTNNAHKNFSPLKGLANIAGVGLRSRSTAKNCIAKTLFGSVGAEARA